MSQSNPQQNSQSVVNLMSTLQQVGELSNSFGALTVPDFAQQIAQAATLDPKSMQTPNPFLGSVVGDDSSSIRFAGNMDNYCQASNFLLDELGFAGNAISIQLRYNFLNRGELFPFLPLVQLDPVQSQQKNRPVYVPNIHMPRLRTNSFRPTHMHGRNQAYDPAQKFVNFDPSGSTPMYDKVALETAVLIAEYAKFRALNRNTRGALCFVGDGADCGSVKTIDECAAIVTDAFNLETLVIYAIGLSDAPTECRGCGTPIRGHVASNAKACAKCGARIDQTDFYDIFTRMGVPASNVQIANDGKALRAALGNVSEHWSSLSQAQSPAQFSSIAAGGFGTP